MDDRVMVSVVIPIFNEVENLPILYDELSTVFSDSHYQYELIFVDDGSDDGSDKVANRLAGADERVRVIHFRRNYGQTAAMHAGIQAAQGRWLVTLDGDLQNDPQDIPNMLQVAESGYDVVHGWRKVRQDSFLTRRLPSFLANRLISKVTRFPIHDLGCTLKVLDREIAQELDLYGELHRFIPILAYWRGARCSEVLTHHRPRRFGTTKYGLSRTLRVLLDLITVHFMLRYSAKPMQWFGLLGVGSSLIGFLSLCGVIAMKFSLGTDMTGNPLILVCVLAAILAVQFISLGILGETAARIFFQTRGLPPYAVRSTYNLQTEYRGRIGAATATSHFAPREASSETRDPQVAPGKAA